MFYEMKILLRKLRFDKFYSLINIGGLSVGMTASALLLMWVYNQWSYDRFHAKTQQIHQVWLRSKSNGQVSCSSGSSLMIGPTLKDEYPDIVESVRVLTNYSYYVGEGGRQIKVRTCHVDPSFLSVFSFPLLKGDVNTALNAPNSVILTEKVAQRLFGDEDPMGKTLKFDIDNLMTVTGVMKDLPDNTRFEFEVLAPFRFVEDELERYSKRWDNISIETYVELTPFAQLDKLNVSVCSIVQRHTGDQTKAEVFLYPLKKSYLYNKFDNGVPSGGRITFLLLFAGLAFFILLIACINFVNLSTARAAVKAKEVGVRKVLGSKRIGICRLFLSESIILSFISGMIAFCFIYITLPWFSGWLVVLGGKILTLEILNIRFWLLALAFILFTALLAGLYPALYLSAFRPEKVLKGAVSITGSRNVSLRRVLVIVQLSIAIFLMIGVMVVRRQLIHSQSRDPGYNREQLIYFPMDEGIDNNYAVFRNDLEVSGAVKSVTRTYSPMTELWGSTWRVKWKGKDPDDRRIFDIYFADSNWATMIGLQLIAGRFPDPAVWPTDSTALLINETAAKNIGLDDPVGETISFWGLEGHVIGIIKDFILRSPFDKIEAMIIGAEKIGSRHMVLIQLTPGNTADKVLSVERIYKKYVTSDHPFECKFVDEQYAAKFNEIIAIGSLSALFTIIAILISCMGLFALVTFTVERRKKEMGIRKVLGASVVHIMILISKEYFVMTLIAFVIATPVAWMTMLRFLDMFDYRTNIPVWLIVAVGVFVLLIALLTVGFQAVKTASANPIKAIKTE